MFTFGIPETDVRLTYCLTWSFMIILPLIPVYLPKRRLLYWNSNFQLPAAIFYEASPWVRVQFETEKQNTTLPIKNTRLFKNQLRPDHDLIWKKKFGKTLAVHPVHIHSRLSSAWSGIVKCQLQAPVGVMEWISTRKPLTFLETSTVIVIWWLMHSKNYLISSIQELLSNSLMYVGIVDILNNSMTSEDKTTGMKLGSKYPSCRGPCLVFLALLDFHFHPVTKTLLTHWRHTALVSQLPSMIWLPMALVTCNQRKSENLNTQNMFV